MIAPEGGEGGDSRTLTRNVLLNLLGLGLPLIAAVIAVPHLDRILGTERYGLLLIAWMLLGYFSLFDLGLGRALTHLVAAKLAEDPAGVPVLIRTGLFLTLALGIGGSLLLGALTPWIMVLLADRLSVEVATDCRHALYVLSATVPVVIVTAALRGILEARHRFDLVNVVRLPLGIATYAGPLLVIPFSATLFAATLVLAIARLGALVAHYAMAKRVFPDLHPFFVRSPTDPLTTTHLSPPASGNSRVLDLTLIRPLVRFGGWMTVSNIISPMMVYMDRVVIGAVLTAAAVAYYATPWEIVTKLLIIPAALGSVLFPAFSHRIGSTDEIKRIFVPSIKALMIVLFPLTLLTVVFAEPALLVWMGPDYAAASARPLQILAVGVFFNGLALIPFSLIQGSGRPDITAKLHMAELPVYAAMLAAFIYFWGITGVALAWSVRTGIDLCLLLWVGRRLAALRIIDLIRLCGGLAASLALLAAAFVPHTLSAQLLFVALVLVLGGMLTWRFVLQSHERRALISFSR